MPIWPNKFLSGEFHIFHGNGHYLVKSTGLTAIQTNKFLTGEFRVFRRKVIITGFGHRHGNLAVNLVLAGQNSYYSWLGLPTGLFLQVKWYEVRALKLITEFLRVG